MYELFYKFLIEDILFQYFEDTSIEAGDKFFLVIESKEHRVDFFEALRKSPCTKECVVSFSGYEDYGTEEAEYITAAFHCGNTDRMILISECDTANDGFQTMIRNHVGMKGSPIQDMAALFIIPGTNALETLLSAGQNLQESPNPLSVDSIANAIRQKVQARIHKFEQAYLDNHIKCLSSLDDYTSLFDFAPILSVLQEQTLSGHFADIDAFEDSEIYQNEFAANDIKSRVEDNNKLFSVIRDMMSEVSEQDAYKKLITCVDSKLAKNISKGIIDWRKLDYSEVRKSHEQVVSNPTIMPPTEIKVDGHGVIVRRTIGPKNGRTSKTYIIVCDPDKTCTKVTAVFNKDLKDYTNKGAAKISGNKLIFPLSKGNILSGTVGDDKNNHHLYILCLQTNDVFQDIATIFTIKKNGQIVVEIPEDKDSITIGCGDNQVLFDGLLPVEIDHDTFFKYEFDHNGIELPVIPFKFGDSNVRMLFKCESDVIPPLSPSAIIDAIWNDNESFTHNGEEDDITSSINNSTGTVSIYDRFRKLVSLEKRMIDSGHPFLYFEENEIDHSYTIISDQVNVPYGVRSILQEIFEYFKCRNTVPSFVRPDNDLCLLYERYVNEVHNAMSNIPTTNMFIETEAANISKLGVVQMEDGSIMLSPFHPLMVAYVLQLSKSVDDSRIDKKVLNELSPLYLMPFIYYNDNNFMAISCVDTEDILTWVKYERVNESKQLSASLSTSKLINEKIDNFIDKFGYYFPDSECPIQISSVGLSHSVDLIRGIVYFIDEKRKKGNVQRVEIHEYVDDMLSDTFFEKLNRQSSRDGIASLFDEYEFNVSDVDLNEVIRLLKDRVSYFKHSLNKSRKMSLFCHITFYKIDSGSIFAPMPANSLRVEASLDGLVSIPSTNLINSDYLMGFGTNGLKENDSPIYLMAEDMNSLYTALANGGYSQYMPNRCTAKRYSFNDEDLLKSVYQNSTWVTFINPELDIDFFYKKKDLYVVHYVEHHSISARLESITVTQHVVQYNKMLHNSLQRFKSIIGTSEEFSRKMINYFNCLNGKWLLDISNKPELIMREKMSLVATCLVMQHFLKRTGDILWIPIALDEIVRATGSIGLGQNGLFSKKDLGVKGPLSDDILMMGIRPSVQHDKLNVYFYPVEVKVLANDDESKGEAQVVNLYKYALNDVLYKSNSFTNKVYKALFAAHFLSNAAKMHANEILSDEEYKHIEDYRYELLNVKFDISEDLPADIGKAALVVYSDDAPKSIVTEWCNDVPVCHIRMLESDCYQLVTKPTNNLLSFVEDSAIVMHSDQGAIESASASTQLDKGCSSLNMETVSSRTSTNKVVEENKSVCSYSSNHINACMPSASNAAEMLESMPATVKINIGSTSKGKPIIFEPNNTTKVSHPNMGIVGGMGFGKTQFALSLIAQFAKESGHNVDKRPIGMLIFDYKGDDYSSDAFLMKVAGKCYSFNFPFNPLKLVVTEKTKCMNLPAVTADRISDSFAKAYGLGQIQQSTIKQVILQTYQDFGITSDPSTWDNPLPTMNNVVDKYFEQYDAKDKTYVLFDKLRDYTIFTPDNTRCVSLFEWLDGVKVIDLTAYPGDTKKVIVSLILDLFYEEMRQLGASKLEGEYRELRAMILVDEAHQFLNKDFNSFRNIISEGRMFGVGMVLSTQNLSDFKSAKQEYSQFILSWVILHLNNITKTEVANIFGANDPNCQAYVDIVSKAEKFYGICKLGNDVKPIRTLPYYELLQKDSRFIEDN